MFHHGCIPGRLIIPTAFNEALSYEQQIEFLHREKQNKLVAGDGIDITHNDDGTDTISTEV